MVKAKYQFTLLLLLLILVAFAAGWYLGSRSEDKRIAKREAEIETVAHALNAATFINRVYQVTDMASPEEQNQRRNNMLISELLYLARAEPYKNENQEDTFLMHADHAFDLLRVEDHAELMRAVEKSRLIDSVKAPFLDLNNDEYDATTAFVRQAFDRRKAQPIYPARVWLKAVVDNDPGRLKSAYSGQVVSKDEDWHSRIQKYRQQLANDLGEYDKYQFSFQYSNALDKEGEVKVFYKDKEYRTFKIVREGTGWRLDEL